MASWQNVLMFASSAHALKPARAVSVMKQYGLLPEPFIRLLVPVDAAGHLLDAGDEVALKTSLWEDLDQRLTKGEQLAARFGNADIAINCLFEVNGNNPHLRWGWPRSLMTRLDQATQSRYWQAMRECAAAVGATYVIVADDADDLFEDRFLEVNGLRYLDSRVDHEYGHGIRSVWVNKALGGSPPIGPSLATGEEIGNGFCKYELS